MKKKKTVLKVFFSVMTVFLALTCILSSIETKKIKAEGDDYYTDYINSIGQFHIMIYGLQQGEYVYLGNQDDIMNYQHSTNMLYYQNNTENYIDGTTLRYLDGTTGEDSSKYIIAMEYYGWYDPDNATWTSRSFNINKVAFSCVFDNQDNEFPNGYNLGSNGAIRLFTIGNNSIDNVTNITNSSIRTLINSVDYLYNNYLFYGRNSNYKTKLGNFITGYNYVTGNNNYNNYCPNLCIEIPTAYWTDYVMDFQYISWNMANDTNWSGLIEYYKNRSYSEGYNEGFDQGLDQGYIQGATASDQEWLAKYNRDMTRAKEEGFQEGVESINSEWGSYRAVMNSTFTGFKNILNIEIFPHITIAMIIGLPLLLGAFLIVLKLIRG